VLFNEPKLLKSTDGVQQTVTVAGFSALQRAEIAEIRGHRPAGAHRSDVSVLFNEPKLLKCGTVYVASSADPRFSALQRAEIAEMMFAQRPTDAELSVSVLFNEPKLLKSVPALRWVVDWLGFQCSSTSRNC